MSDFNTALAAAIKEQEARNKLRAKVREAYGLRCRLAEVEEEVVALYKAYHEAKGPESETEENA